MDRSNSNEHGSGFCFLGHKCRVALSGSSSVGVHWCGRLAASHNQTVTATPGCPMPGASLAPRDRVQEATRAGFWVSWPPVMLPLTSAMVFSNGTVETRDVGGRGFKLAI